MRQAQQEGDVLRAHVMNIFGVRRLAAVLYRRQLAGAGW